MRTIISVIAIILSYSPVMSITDDDNFGTIEKKNRKNIGCVRVSFVQLMCGPYKVYLFTWTKIKGRIAFDFIKVIALKKIVHKQFETIENNCKKYKVYLKSISINQVFEEKEDLCYHIDNEKKRIETSNEKINTYMTIFLTVIPIIIPLADWISIWKMGLFIRIAIMTLGFLMCNIIVYIFFYLKVGSYERYGFSELKIQNKEKRKKKKILRRRNELLYSDWQHIREEAAVKVSYVLNLQKWIAFSFVYVIVLLLVA